MNRINQLVVQLELVVFDAFNIFLVEFLELGEELLGGGAVFGVGLEAAFDE